MTKENTISCISITSKLENTIFNFTKLLYYNMEIIFTSSSDHFLRSHFLRNVSKLSLSLKTKNQLN